MELDNNVIWENEKILQECIPIAIASFLETTAQDKKKIEELNNFLLEENKRITSKEKD